MSSLPSRTRRLVKRQLSNERPTVWIGKNGISPELLQEVEKQLKKREMVKIKVLASALEKKTEEIALEMTRQTLASLVEVRGHTFMLYKRRER
ncbi:RNA-binding protein [Candidatus Bathyarchaeota archaeon]|nr:RNA-binding protein [Candidatus Bathyarchaeota archaeon]